MTTHQTREPFDLASAALRLRAVAAARGDAPFDRLIVNAILIDMVTGERRAADVGLTGPLIASVHAPGSRSDAGGIIDAQGGYLSNVCIPILDAYFSASAKYETTTTENIAH